MGRIVYIGRESQHLGKTAFKILANLKNFGINRMLTRHEFDKFPEPSFHIVKKVETYMDPELKYGTIWCETVIRGKRLPGIRPLKIGFKPDFRLIPRDEEVEFIRGYKIENLGDNINILPKSYTVPPLMQEYMKRHFNRLQLKNDYIKSDNDQFKIPFVYRNHKDDRKEDADLFWIANRIAKDDFEKPTVSFDGKYYFNEEYKKSMSDQSN
ncbi:hypothetical protein RDWZM_003788 [Blomia tropicalis]|uniref:Uncharacterized protein n=1 Tax=Blomia tropicalis TaxID=40697 RepID=A0A9Q0MFW5_BLOTA|nr:Mitochondrial 28S ribosomal protein S34 [Blomia tropicalis]KAJ6225243.1 hypothetical protein RDWZM_003788 [Blomia tropicalis]